MQNNESLGKVPTASQSFNFNDSPIRVIILDDGYDIAVKIFAQKGGAR